MSHQPSAIDNIKSTTSSAYETVTSTINQTEQGEYDPDKEKSNFKRDVHGNTVKKGDLKDKLNNAALGGPPEKEESFFETGALAVSCPEMAARMTSLLQDEKQQAGS
jgi:hypothetical protein